MRSLVIDHNIIDGIAGFAGVFIFHIGIEFQDQIVSSMLNLFFNFPIVIIRMVRK